MYFSGSFTVTVHEFILVFNAIFIMQSLLSCSSEFDDVLKAWCWPFIISTVKVPQMQQNTAELKQRLEPLFNHLLQLQLPYP